MIMSNLKYIEKRVVEDSKGWPHVEFNVNTWFNNDEEYQLYCALSSHYASKVKLAMKFPDVEKAVENEKIVKGLLNKFFNQVEKNC